MLVSLSQRISRVIPDYAGIYVLLGGLTISFTRQSSFTSTFIQEYEEFFKIGQAILTLGGLLMMQIHNLQEVGIHLKKLKNNQKILIALTMILAATTYAPGMKILNFASAIYLCLLIAGFYLIAVIRWSSESARERDISVIIIASGLIVVIGLIVEVSKSVIAARLAGLLEGPNFLGLFSATIFLLCILWSGNSSKFLQSISLILVFVSSISVQASGTRTSFLALLITLVFLILQKRRLIPKRLLFSGLLGIATYSVFNKTFPNRSLILENGNEISITNAGFTALDRTLKVDPGEGGGGVFSGRIYLWESAVNKILENPLIGIGFNPIQDTSGFFPHNIFLQLIYLVGIPLGFFLIWLIYLYAVHLKSNKYIRSQGILLFVLLNAFFSDFILGAGGPVWLLSAFLVSYGYSLDKKRISEAKL